MTRCTKCQISKVTSAFGYQKLKSGFMRLRSECKFCRTDTEKQRYQLLTNEQKLKRKDNFYKRTYGITLETYNNMLLVQEHKCAACKRHCSELSKSLVVDHSHDTGKVRGLLCAGCNLALGSIHENPERLLNLATYIKGFN